MRNQIPISAPRAFRVRGGETAAMDTQMQLPAPPQGWVWEILPSPLLTQAGAFMVAYSGEGTLFPSSPTIILYIHTLIQNSEIEEICEQAISDHERGPNTYGRLGGSGPSETSFNVEEPIALASLRLLY